jgi:hypothetical protein
MWAFLLVVLMYLLVWQVTLFIQSYPSFRFHCLPKETDSSQQESYWPRNHTRPACWPTILTWYPCQRGHSHLHLYPWVTRSYTQSHKSQSHRTIRSIFIWWLHQPTICSNASRAIAICQSLLQHKGRQSETQYQGELIFLILFANCNNLDV